MGKNCEHKTPKSCKHPEAGGGRVDKPAWECSPVCGYHKPKKKRK